MSHRNFSVAAAHSDSIFLHSILVLAHLHRPVAQTAVPTSCTEVLASPQFRPPSLQMKGVFRQGFSKIFAKLSRKINLYDRLERFSNSPIHSQNAQGRDIMRRTQDTKVMYLGLPSFLVNMLLDIGRDSIHIIYT